MLLRRAEPKPSVTRLARALLILAGCTRASARNPPRPSRVDVTRAVIDAAAPDVAPVEVIDSSCGHAIPGPLPGRAVVTEHRDEAANARARGLHLTFVGDPSHTITVQWSTREVNLSSELRYRREGDRADRVARGYSFVYAGSDGRRQHRVHLCGLEAGARYAYAVTGDPNARGSFVTAPDGPGPVRVLVTGDSRSNPAVWRTIAERAMRERPDVMIFTGDAVDDGSFHSYWEAFFDAAPALLASVPAYWIDGNHEGINNVTDAQFAYPPNGDAEHHGRWWSSTYGPVKLIGLNDVTLPPLRVIARDETAFLERELASVDRARTPWVITAHHCPLHTTSGGIDNENPARRAWGARFDRYGVDLDLAGHTHNYQSSRAMLSDESVTEGARGTRYLTFGGAGAELYQFRATAPWVSHQEVTHGYAMLTVDARRARWAARRLDGTVIEAFEMPTR